MTLSCATLPATRLLLSHGWLAKEPVPFQQAVLDRIQIRRFDTGQYTHHIGDDPGGIFGILGGSFGVMTQSPTLGVVLGHIFGAGAWFGQGPLATGGARMLTFRAMQPALVAHVPLPAIQDLSRVLPEAPLRLAGLVEYNAAITYQIAGELLIRRSDQRIAAVLLRVVSATQSSHGDDPTACLLTQTDLAEMANVSRQTMNTVLKRFESEGWIARGYGKLSVRDMQGLRDFLTGGD